jgi:endonuclease YncB( thermonuclease family)
MLALLMAAAIQAAPAEEPLTTPYRAEVTLSGVVDGDTFMIGAPLWSIAKHLRWSLREEGIDTPEHDWRAKCPAEKERGIQAIAYAQQLFAQKGWHIRAYDLKQDKYGGRLDGRIRFLDGTWYNDLMIAAGYAKPYTGEGPKPDWCSFGGERG